MIDKSILTSVIAKYNLAHRNESVKWRINDKQLTVYFGTVGQVGKVVMKDFDFEDSELAIFNTSQLSKLLSITQGNLLFTTEKQNKIYTKLFIADSNFELTYSLADVMMIPKIQYYKDADSYEVELELDKEEIANLIRAKNALLESESMLITTTEDLDGEPIVEFIFGDNTGFSNKITYQLRGKIDKQNIELPFNAILFRDILKVNSDADSAKLKLNQNGLLKLEFENKNTESEYFIARNE
jgi:hypothetical protein